MSHLLPPRDGRLDLGLSPDRVVARACAWPPYFRLKPPLLVTHAVLMMAVNGYCRVLPRNTSAPSRRERPTQR